MQGNAVHIGAGSIGRGFIGQLYFESGYHTTFIDVVDDVVNAINAEGSYPIDIVTDDKSTRIVVRNIDAVNGKDLELASNTLAMADIASTAVGLNAMRHIAPLLARAIEIRFTSTDAAPLDIILCENINDGKTYVRELIRNNLSASFHAVLESKVGLVEASIGRMVPVMTPEQCKQNPLLVCVEPYCELPVDESGFRGGIPKIKHMKPAKNFSAYVERKLFAHNLTHACTAYLGYLKGYTYIYEAIRDSAILEVVQGAGRESCMALAKKHDIAYTELQYHVNDLIQRYHNRALADQIRRVARDPKRKLAPGDRLTGPATMCVQYQIEPKNIALAIAAALYYDPKDTDDPTSSEVQAMIDNYGLKDFLQNYCKIDPSISPGSSILEAYAKIPEFMTSS